MLHYWTGTTDSILIYFCSIFKHLFLLFLFYHFLCLFATKSPAWFFSPTSVTLRQKRLCVDILWFLVQLISQQLHINPSFGVPPWHFKCMVTQIQCETSSSLLKTTCLTMWKCHFILQPLGTTIFYLKVNWSNSWPKKRNYLIICIILIGLTQCPPGSWIVLDLVSTRAISFVFKELFLIIRYFPSYFNNPTWPVTVGTEKES